MAIDIGRRQFVSALSGAAVAWPLAARAQQPGVPVIGFLAGGSAEVGHSYVAAFGQGLRQSGYVDGKNIAIDYRWAAGQYDRLPELAAELVRHQIAVLATWTPVAALAAKRATTTIPIVFALGSDPVKDGLVSSLNRPGGNITGATFFANLLDAKRLDLFHQLVPTAKVIGVLLNPKNSQAGLQKSNALEAARGLGLQLVFAEASTGPEINKAVASLIDQQSAALFVAGDAFLLDESGAIIELASRNALPVCFTTRQQVAAGALLSYGASFEDTFRQAGNYVGRILKGEKPADLPVQQPTKFELVINLKTAKTLGLSIPPSLLSAADEVIE